MNKTIIALMAALPLCASAQLSNLFKTDNQALVEQAIADGIVLVSQSYQLADSTGKRYGRYGEQEFGKVKSLGFRVDSGLVVSASTATPWDFDDNFDRYRESYTPELYQTSICSFDADSASCSADSIQLVYTQIGEGLYFAAAPGSMAGYAPKKYSGQTDGWMAWVYNVTDSEGTPTNEYRYQVVKHKQQMSARGESMSVQAPADGKEYLGGVFLVPEQTAVGQITFYLAGIVIGKGDSDEWMLTLPSALMDGAVEGSGNPKTLENELTPTIRQALDNSKDGKKNKKSKDKKKK